MGKIKKIIENELVGGIQQDDIYPVTSFKAVYNKSNEKLDDVLRRIMPVNISTEYNEEHTAEELTLREAVSKVPTDDRSLGFQATFLSANGWVNYRFDGQSLLDWANLGSWTQIATLPEVQQSADEVISSLADRQNIIDSTKYVEGYFINADNGVIEKNILYPAVAAISGYSIVKPNTDYKVFSAITDTGLSSIHFYDIDMKWIGKSTSLSQFTTPVNAYYINVCWLKTGLKPSESFNFEDVKKSTVIYDASLAAPTEYVPYDKYMLKEYLISNSNYIKGLVAQIEELQEAILDLMQT